MRAVRGGLRLALLAMALISCRAPAPPPGVPIEGVLVGARLIDPSTEGGARPQYDADARPRLRITAGTAPFTVTLAHGGQMFPVSTRARVDHWGTHVRVREWPATLPVGAGEVIIRSGDGATRRWPVLFAASPEAHAGLAEVIELRKTGDRAAARARLDALPSGDPLVTLWGAVERARLAQGEDDTSAIAEWVSAAAIAEQLGHRGEAGRRLRAAAYVAVWSERLDQARALTQRAAAFDQPAVDPIGHGKLRYSQAMLSARLGDWGAARQQLTEARAIFQAYDERPMLRLSTELLALIQADLGDLDGAVRTLESLAPTIAEVGADARARFLLNLAWISLRALPDRPEAERLATVRARLDEARVAARTSGKAAREANAAVNQAWGALLAGALDAAAGYLGEARALDPGGASVAAPYIRLLTARVALARDQLDAAAEGFQALEAEARAVVGGGDAELAWRARFGLGRVERARQRPELALAAFRAALAEVERIGRQASLRDDRAVFHAARRALVDETVSLLIDLGQTSAAFEVADAARARPLRALQSGLRVSGLDPARQQAWAERLGRYRAAAEALRTSAAQEALIPVAEEAAWRRRHLERQQARDAAFDAAFGWLDAEAPGTVPAGISGVEAQARLGPDEALFALVPLGERWLAFWVDRQRLEVEPRSVDADPLGAWRARLAGVEHLYVVPGGHPRGLAVATAGARPALLDASVAFLPYAGMLRGDASGVDGSPLVVADPRGDLAWARKEGQSVAERLSGPRTLTGSEARLDAVLAGLATASVFHFAGHGVLRPDAPWDAHLRLAEPDTLSLAEVLAHPVAARVAVLSGCETGTDEVLLDERVVGLPEAFLAAGARSVVATDRPIDDRITLRFMSRFYAAGGATRPAEALRHAARALRDDGEALWSAFRLIGMR